MQKIYSFSATRTSSVFGASLLYDAVRDWEKETLKNGFVRIIEKNNTEILIAVLLMLLATAAGKPLSNWSKL